MLHNTLTTSFLTADASRIAQPAEQQTTPSLSERIRAHAVAIGITGPKPLILQGGV